MWIHHEGQDSPISHGHDVNYNYMTPHNRGVYALQANPGNDDDSTLTPNCSNSISGNLHGLSLYSCWMHGKEGHLSQYHSKIVGRGRYEPDPHTLYPHLKHAAPHDISNSYDRWVLPQLGNIGLQKEPSRINKVNGLVKTGTESPSSRPNHPHLGDKNSKMQADRQIRECDCGGGRCNTCCSHKKNTSPTREPYYALEGTMHNFNGKGNKILDWLPIRSGQVQHDLIRQKWPRPIVENDHWCYVRDQEQCTQQKSVGNAKARFTGIADITNGEFQGHYVALDTDQQINSANG